MAKQEEPTPEDVFASKIAAMTDDEFETWVRRFRAEMDRDDIRALSRRLLRPSHAEKAKPRKKTL